MNQYDNFWKQTKEELRKIPLNLKRIKQVYPLPEIKVEKITFQSLLNETIHGILLLPEGETAVPLVIDYLGYMNYIQEPWNFVHWLQVGCGCLVIDNRGQGGRTLDQVPYQTVCEEMPIARGFLKPEDFYMRRVYADSLRTIEVAHQIAEVDKNKIILRGGSQGGGVALMTNALSDYPILATFADVPSHSNILHRMQEKTGSYSVIQEYLDKHPEDKVRIQETMPYFDCQNFVHKIENPVYTSVGSKDPVCPMTDFFSTYRKIHSPKTLRIYLNKGHGGGESKQIKLEMQTIQRILQEC